MAGADAPVGSAARRLPLPNGNELVYVAAHGGDPARPLQELGLTTNGGRPVIVVVGGAGDLAGRHRAYAEAVLGPAVSKAAKGCGAVVVDGGTDAGVMSVVGAARHRRPTAMPVLLGVAPRGKVGDPAAPARGDEPFEPHHSHLLLAAGHEYGDETPLLFRSAEALAGDQRVIVLLAGGGPVASREVGEAVRRGWPLVALSRSGGLARRLARLRKLKRDAPLRALVRDGDIRFFDGRDAPALARWIEWELTDAPLLKDAWRTFAEYNRLASALRGSYERFQRNVIWLGLTATALAVAFGRWDLQVLHWLTIAATTVTAVAIALASRRAVGKRWVLLRGAAEAVKVEIFRYRTRTGDYAGAGRDIRFREELGKIDGGLTQTEASSGPLAPPPGPSPPALNGSNDGGLNVLRAEDYVEQRVADQLAYYRARVARLSRQRNALQLVSIGFGGLGPALAAVHLDPVVAVTTAISAGAISYLSTLQADNLIVVYNQSIAGLADIRREWLAAKRGRTLARLVTQTETILTTELSGWVNQMNTTVDEQAERLAAAGQEEPA